MTIRNAIVLSACLLAGFASSAQAQQKPQWVPGQAGLNAGIVPAPGFTFVNMPITYSANQLNNSDGDRIRGLSGSYSYWLDENIFMYVPKFKILGGNYAPSAIVTIANGSVVGDIPGTRLNVSAGGSGFSDTYVQPLNIGWHTARADTNAGYAFVAPTGQFNQGASNNIGSGYWGNFMTAASTIYLTANKGTSANIFAGWETHSQKRDTDIRPGQALTTEWGFGQALPLKKDKSRLLQLGLIGYDQWQTSASSGTNGLINESAIPFYSNHAIGFESDFIVPAKNISVFFKYEDEYSARATTQGRTIVFGGAYTMHTVAAVTP